MSSTLHRCEAFYMLGNELWLEVWANPLPEFAPCSTPTPSPALTAPHPSPSLQPAPLSNQLRRVDIVEVDKGKNEDGKWVYTSDPSRADTPTR